MDMVACSEFQVAVSAIVDGEEPGIAPDLVDRHVSRCATCRTFRAELDRWGRPARLDEAPPMPDLSRRVVELNAMADRAGKRGAIRALLAVVAVEVIVLSIPTLVLGEQRSSAVHAARHLGAFSVAYAVGLLVVVARPARARTMLPVTMVLGGALLVTAVIDVTQGQVPLLGEASHLPEILSVVFVWMLARPASVTR